MSRVIECAIKIATFANKCSAHLSEMECLELNQELEARLFRSKINTKARIKFQQKKK